MSDDIRLEIDSKGLARITFARPEVANAVRPATMRSLCGAIDQAAADSKVRALILTGDGKNFAAGADFDWLNDLLSTETPAVREDLYHWFKGAVERLWKCPKPTVAAVNGAAITVGCELALACDVRLASPTSRFGEIWLELGLLPPLGGAVLLPRIVGLTWAKKMILEAVIVDGATALEIGLVDELVSEPELLARAEQRALAMAAFPPEAFAAAKAALHRGLESTMDAEWEANVQRQAELIGSAAFRKQVEARLRPR
jgi:enoyl-CoA hydratase/carnithine racemase